MKKLYVDRGITQSRAAIFVNDKLEELYVENTNFTSINGNIYRGKIENIEEGLCAAFVNIGLEKNALLHFEQSSELKQFRKGQEIIVQVIREASGTKGPRVSTELSIPGKYVVLLPSDNYIGVSKKIDDVKLRRSIKNHFDKVVEEGFGVIIRTEARDISIEELELDYKKLKDSWKVVEQNSKYLKSPILLFDAKSYCEFIIREYIKNDIDIIYTNTEGDAELFKENLNLMPKCSGIEVKYDPYNLSFQEKIDKEINEANKRKIQLPSGGYITIDYTEAFICIDVNSGSYTGLNNTEDTILAVNLEACLAIERAVRIKRLSGIILIDFIDMKLDSSRNKVIEVLGEAFFYDKSNFRIFGFTKLGILETTRAKNGIKLADLIYQDLNKDILSPAYCFKLIENKCIKSKQYYNKTNFTIMLESNIYDVASSLLNEFITQMRNIYSIELHISRNSNVTGFSIING